MNTLLYIISVFCVTSGILCAAFIAWDIFGRGNKQSMPVMNAVWPLTGLWAGWIGLAAYVLIGRTAPGKDEKPMNMGHMHMDGAMKDMDPKKPDMHAAMNMSKDMKMKMDMKPTSGAAEPTFRQVALSTLHCGAGCSLADLVGEWLGVFFIVTVFGSALAGQWTLDYVLALAFGLYFQFAAIRSMRKIPAGQAIKNAFRIDFLSLTAWQVGMYGLMAILIFGVFGGHFFAKTTWQFWFAMQLAMGAGFLTAFPVNIWLIKKGIKPAMM